MLYGDLLPPAAWLELCRLTRFCYLAVWHSKDGIVDEPRSEKDLILTNESDFRVRLQQEAREVRDDAVEKLRQKYAYKMTTLKERIRRAEQAVEREATQAKQQKTQAAISIGATILGALTGRKSLGRSALGKATTAARGVSRSMESQGDVTRAKETVEALQQQFNDLQAEFDAEANELAAQIDLLTEGLETIEIKPKKTDISVQLVALV
jgi:hypothetical protein